MGSIGKRIISKGYLLYEYLNDEDRYALVGVVDSTLDGHSINPETGIDTDKEEAEEFFEIAINEIKRIEKLLTTFSETSITYKINENTRCINNI